MVAGLWREATVFNGQFQVFAVVGAPVDIAAMLVPAILTFLLRARPAFRCALAGTVLFALALAAWFIIVAPANDVLATWQPGPIPEDFVAVRNRWETGHMIVTALKLLGFIAIAIAAVIEHETAGDRQRKLAA